MIQSYKILQPRLNNYPDFLNVLSMISMPPVTGKSLEKKQCPYSQKLDKWMFIIIKGVLVTTVFVYSQRKLNKGDQLKKSLSK